MVAINREFYVSVFDAEGNFSFDFEMKHEVSEEENQLLEKIPSGKGLLEDSKELANLYSRLEDKAFEEAIQKFWDNNPDASDDAFNDCQVSVDI